MTFRRLFSSVGKTIYPGSASPKEIKTYLQLCLSFYYKVDLLTRRVTIRRILRPRVWLHVKAYQDLYELVFLPLRDQLIKTPGSPVYIR